MKKIAVLGPNPARQKTLFFNGFVRGAVNRAAVMEQLAAGKGINFCRAARIFGAAECVLIQFCGGENGDFVISELEKERLSAVSIPTVGKTRCCVTCLDRNDRSMTELIEPTFPASEPEIAALLSAFERELTDGSGAAFCGSLPDGTDPRLYARAASIAARADALLLIDAFRDLDAVFASGAEIVLKINREELLRLSGQSELESGLKTIFGRFANLRFAAITDGAGVAYASDGRKLCSYELPPLPAPVVSPLGSGDTASAVLLSSILAGNAPFDAFGDALGAASANCLNATPGLFDPAEARKLKPTAEVQAD